MCICQRPLQIDMTRKPQFKRSWLFVMIYCRIAKLYTVGEEITVQKETLQIRSLFLSLGLTSTKINETCESKSVRRGDPWIKRNPQVIECYWRLTCSLLFDCVTALNSGTLETADTDTSAGEAEGDFHSPAQLADNREIVSACTPALNDSSTRRILA